MSVKKINQSATRSPMARIMDVTMIGTTIGGASLANLILPTLGSVIVGAILGAIFGFRATSRPELQG